MRTFLKRTQSEITPDACEGLTQNETERANCALSKVTRWNIDELRIQIWLAIHHSTAFQSWPHVTVTSALTRRRRRATFIAVCSDSFDPSFDRSEVGQQPLVFSARKKIWQVTWRSSALSLGPRPLYQKTPPFLLQLLARVCNRGTVSFPLSELSVTLDMSVKPH